MQRQFTVDVKVSLIIRLLRFVARIAPTALNGSIFRGATPDQIKASFDRVLPRNQTFPGTMALYWQTLAPAYDAMLDYDECDLMHKRHIKRQAEGFGHKDLTELHLELVQARNAAVQQVENFVGYYFPSREPRVVLADLPIQQRELLLEQEALQAPPRVHRVVRPGTGDLVIQIYLGRRDPVDLIDLEEAEYSD